MDHKILKTNADDLYELVRAKHKISVEEAAKLLKLPVDTVQALVDFLVEEKIFGIEYKFTTPFIYLSRDDSKENIELQGSKKIMTKEEFFQKAKNWKVPFETINELWNKYVGENLNYIKEAFNKKAKERNISEDKIDELWKKYMTYLR